jgi:hypothetical protein
MTENQKKKETLTDEIIDLEWEELEDIFQARQVLNETEHKLASLCLQWEKTKVSYLAQISNIEHAMNAAAQGLLVDKNVDQNLTYELKLPAAPDEKGYFLRRDEK